MRIALAPSMKELVGDKLLRHPDPDVKAALAACISEITRISAPDTPYDDDQMKVCIIFFDTVSMACLLSCTLQLTSVSNSAKFC
jgi:hypothetical protein